MFKKTLIFILMAIFVSSVYADTEIGITYNKVIEDVGIGFTAKTEHQVTKNIDVEFNTQGQYANTLLRGKYHASVLLFDYVKVYQDGLFRGYAGQKLGRQADLGIAVQFPFLTESGVGVGVFGRSGGEFGKPTLADIAEQNGINPDNIHPDSQGLTADPTGLNVRPGQSVNLLVYTDFEYRGVDVGVKFMPQITGEDKAHQLVITSKMVFPIGKSVEFHTGFDVGFQHYRDTIEYETAGLGSIVLSF